MMLDSGRAKDVETAAREMTIWASLRQERWVDEAVERSCQRCDMPRLLPGGKVELLLHV